MSQSEAMKQFKVFDEEYEVEESEDEQKCGAEHEYADSTSSSDEDQVETPPSGCTHFQYINLVIAFDFWSLLVALDS